MSLKHCCFVFAMKRRRPGELRPAKETLTWEFDQVHRREFERRSASGFFPSLPAHSRKHSDLSSQLNEQEALGFWYVDRCYLEGSTIASGILLHYAMPDLVASARQTRRRLTKGRWHLAPCYVSIKAVPEEASSHI